MQDSKVKASNEAAKATESETGPETMEWDTREYDPFPNMMQPQPARQTQV